MLTVKYLSLRCMTSICQVPYKAIFYKGLLPLCCLWPTLADLMYLRLPPEQDISPTPYKRIIYPKLFGARPSLWWNCIRPPQACYPPSREHVWEPPTINAREGGIQKKTWCCRASLISFLLILILLSKSLWREQDTLGLPDRGSLWKSKKVFSLMEGFCQRWSLSSHPS